MRRTRGVAEPLKFDGPHGPVLGLFPEARYQNSLATASANDLVVLFTDGLFEVETVEYDYYGTERLLASMRKRIHLPAAKMFSEVVAEIRALCVAGNFIDDVCLLGVEVRRTGLAGQKVA